MYASETFGRIFWVDDNYEFKSCPLNVDETGDFDAWDYVSEWTDWEGVDMNKLFNIHKFCILNKINYNGSLTHREAPVINNLNEEDSMRSYKWDEQFYNELPPNLPTLKHNLDSQNHPFHLHIVGMI